MLSISVANSGVAQGLPEMEYILVQARLVERKDPQLIFAAKVISPDGHKLATCKAIHWIIDNNKKI
jgi:hypothetical protein